MFMHCALVDFEKNRRKCLEVCYVAEEMFFGVALVFPCAFTESPCFEEFKCNLEICYVAEEMLFGIAVLMNHLCYSFKACFLIHQVTASFPLGNSQAIQVNVDTLK